MVLTGKAVGPAKTKNKPNTSRLYISLPPAVPKTLYGLHFSSGRGTASCRRTMQTSSDGARRDLGIIGGFPKKGRDLEILRAFVVLNNL